ncbi:putative BRCA1-A complex subunit BRE [Iris pallida]|uniref:BRISC and BRCA1-A complex member 2 n=1 Tax=Iris pallida TaxID=29817 RepID=A0AAX6EDN7_IRIPA|nr:putative BRCA1-A complex subunit BRE [Iris pallida]
MAPAAAAAAAPLAPPIVAQLNHLLANSPLSFKVDQVWSGCKDPVYADHFTLLVPFCLDYIRWDVMYNALSPSAAPDIVFPPEDGDFNPLLDIIQGKKQSCLLDWNSKDPTRLLSLVHQIRDLYKDFQRKRVEELDDERLKFETSTILSREGIEVCMTSGSDRLGEVTFAVPLLDMNLNQLIPWCPWRHQQKIFLQVVFPVSTGYSSVPPRIKLVSSSDLKTLFSIEDVKLPPWVDGMCMAEYLPTLEDNLKVQLMEAVASVGARRYFIEALAILFGRPVEADPVFCRTASVFVVSGTFTFLVHFSLPTQFPKLQPILTLQSCQHCTSQGVAIMSPPITDYPWSPRWDASQMAERIFEFLVDECLSFKKYCTDMTPQ